MPDATPSPPAGVERPRATPQARGLALSVAAALMAARISFQDGGRRGASSSASRFERRALGVVHPGRHGDAVDDLALYGQAAARHVESSAQAASEHGRHGDADGRDQQEQARHVRQQPGEHQQQRSDHLQRPVGRRGGGQRPGPPRAQVADRTQPLAPEQPQPGEAAQEHEQDRGAAADARATATATAISTTGTSSSARATVPRVRRTPPPTGRAGVLTDGARLEGRTWSKRLRTPHCVTRASASATIAWLILLARTRARRR